MTGWTTRILGIFVLLAALAGCRTAEIYNAEDMALNTPSQTEMIEVEEAIKRAGGGLGWHIRRADENQPGHLIGRLPIRSHVAVVDINHNTETFSITYRDSTNLNYDAEKGIIHPNYNGWIQNLENAIVRETSMIRAN